MRIPATAVHLLCEQLREWGTDVPLDVEQDLIDEYDRGFKVVAENFHDDMLVGEAKLLLKKQVDDGTICPVCDQHAKIYKRPLHSAMAHDLIACWKHAGTDWFFLPDVVGDRGTGDVTKCRYWGLLEQQQGRREDGSSRNGYWRVTARGELFIQAQVAVPHYVHVYNKEALGFSGAPVTIREALGKKFDYSELMAHA